MVNKVSARSFLVLLIGFFCCLTIFGFSQNKKPASASSYSPDQCTIGFYSRDSVAIKIPEGKPHYDVIADCNNRLDAIREKQIIATDKWLTAKGDSAAVNTPEGKKKQQSALVEVNALRTDSMSEIKKIREHEAALNPLFLKIGKVADSIGLAHGFKQVREANDNSPMICPSDQMLMVDISNEIAIAMHLKPTLLKVGIYNSDSLMRLMPGYAKLADSTLAEMKVYNAELARMDKNIAEKQHELDSLRPTLKKRQISQREEEIIALQDERDSYRGYELYKIDVRDSLRCKAYREKFRIAAATAAKLNGCARSFDEPVARGYYTSKEAEFIDLNADIAKNLSQ